MYLSLQDLHALDKAFFMLHIYYGVTLTIKSSPEYVGAFCQAEQLVYLLQW